MAFHIIVDSATIEALFRRAMAREGNLTHTAPLDTSAVECGAHPGRNICSYEVAMSRGGFISSEKVLAKVALRLTSREEARQVITDALLNGVIAARGSPVPEAEDPPEGVLLCLTELTPMPLDPPSDIPAAFWKGFYKSDLEKWDWHEGVFWNSSSERHPGFVDVVFKERDINTVLKSYLQKASAAPPTPAKKERLRDPSWNEWVAALASLAHEQQIDGNMKQAALLDLVDARLQRWGLATKQRSTLGPVARTVLERFRNRPPGVFSEKP